MDDIELNKWLRYLESQEFKNSYYKNEEYEIRKAPEQSKEDRIRESQRYIQCYKRWLMI